jgi:RNA-directed DNA polymerase
MTTAPISLQDLQRRIYVKAKAEPSWRFWGLYVQQIQDELVTRTYRPMRLRQKAIPKEGGTKVRVLSIPTIRYRVVQGALKLILEPIFEADFQPGSYGYRPKRSAHDAVLRVAEAIVKYKTRVIDVDVQAYFDRSISSGL